MSEYKLNTNEEPKRYPYHVSFSYKFKSNLLVKGKSNETYNKEAIIGSLIELKKEQDLAALRHNLATDIEAELGRAVDVVLLGIYPLEE